MPDLIDRASRALAAARTSAEVLEARDMASFAYTASKAAGRIARAKQAHDEVIAAVYRAQGDALLIEALAKVRLAAEYDGAQQRGEVAGRGGERSGLEHSPALPTAFDFGLTRKAIHEARSFRDAEIFEPGVVAAAIQERVGAGEEPTKASVRQAVEAAIRPHVANNSGNNEWYTPPEILEAARLVLGGFDLDPASSLVANRAVRAARIFTAQDDALVQDWPIGRIWMNPPYAQPVIANFAKRFVAEVARGSIGVVIVNNATETDWFQTLSAACAGMCFPRGRIRFVSPSGKQGTPLQGQVLLYFGPNPAAFFDVFGDLGKVARDAAA